MKNRFLLTLISLLLAVVIGIGGIFLVTLGIRSARSMVLRGEISIDLGTLNYLSAYYKMQYLNYFRITGVNAPDSEEFWQKEISDGVTYGEDFEEKFEIYIRTLVIAADTYHTDHGYTADDRIAVKYAVDTILAQYAQGSVSIFNEQAAKFGFDYNDFQNAVALLYKANGAMELLYGADGERIFDYPEICAEHFSEYSHVSLLYIRLDGLYMTNEDGDYLYDAQGMPALREMTEEEHSERVDLSKELVDRTVDGNMDAEEFRSLLEKNDGDGIYWLDDYYFHPVSKNTKEYAEEYGEIVSTALTMGEGELRMVSLDGALCFIYKHEPGVYENEDNPFLSDFAMNAAPHQYEHVVAPFLDAVRFLNSYEGYSPLSIPEINDFYVRTLKQEVPSAEEKALPEN